MIVFKYLEGRPTATISLAKNNGDWYSFRSIIDSGADLTVIPFSIGKTLGMDEKRYKPRTLGGVGGGLKAIYVKLKMKIGEKDFDARVAWAQIDGIPTLLGRADVFDKFKITFDEKKEEIIFE